MDRKSISIIIILAVVVIGIIFIINYVKGNGNGDETVVECISENSQLIVKEGCLACASQKNILGGHLDKFDMVDCSVEAEKCMNLGIIRVPTWLIEGEKYEGVYSIEKLKDLTGC